jgi:putative transposase
MPAQGYQTQPTAHFQSSQAEFATALRRRLQVAARELFQAVLLEELTAFVQALPYERSPGRRGQRNGSYGRSLGTAFGLLADLQVPRTRDGLFRTQLFERYQRRQPEVDTAIAEMFVRGVSTSQVGQVLETLNGLAPSASTVSRVFHQLEPTFQAWQSRPLPAWVLYLHLDAIELTIKYAGDGVKMAVLAAIGVLPDGRRELLGLTTGEHENGPAWTNLCRDLFERGLQQVGLVISDQHASIWAACEAVWPAARHQACVTHKIVNVLAHVPKGQRAAVHADLKAIFYQADEAQARQVAQAFGARYQAAYPEAVRCLAKDLDACLQFYGFPQEHWRFIRTNNVAERLFSELRRRLNKMGAMPNEGSALLICWAVANTIQWRGLRVDPALLALDNLHKS